MTKSKSWLVNPRPTQSFGFGSFELNHSRGFSTQPPDITTTFASAEWVSPLRLLIQVTPRAIVADPFVSVTILVTYASVTSLTGCPPLCQRSAVSAIGTYELSVERFAARLRGAPRGSMQPWKQKPQNV